MKRVLLEIIFVLFVSSIANAEGAWVLWERYLTNGEGPISDWDINSAYPNYEMCRKKINSKSDFYLEAWKDSSPVSKIHSFENGLMVEGEKLPKGEFRIWFYYEGKCLPDTIDPRK